MRLLITTDTIGGVWTFSQELVQGLLDGGHAVALISLGKEPSAAQRRSCDVLAEGCPDRFLYVASDAPLEWMETNSTAFTEAAPLLLHLARQFDADLLFSNQFCFGMLDVPIPKVLAAHSDVMSWAEACGEPLAKSLWLDRYKSLVRSGLAKAAAVVAPTEWMMSALARSFPLPESRMVINNGRSVPASRGNVRQPQVVTAGRLWDPAKGLSLLKDVRSPMPILMAGETEQVSSGGLSKSYLPGCCELLGNLAESELLHLFQRSAIYLCASRYEPFGLAPLEAALCGCAVVARDIPPLREVWKEGALYFKDALFLSTLLADLQDSPDMLRDAQMRSSRRAGYFTRDRMVKQYLTLFETTVAQRPEIHCVG